LVTERKGRRERIEKGGSRNNSRSLLEGNPEMHKVMKKEETAVKHVQESQRKLSNSKKNTTRSRSSRRRKKRISSTSSEDQSDKAHDPYLYPSPTKFMELKATVQEQKFTIQRVRSLNEKLQDILLAKEEETKRLKGILSEDKGKRGNLEFAHISEMGVC